MRDLGSKTTANEGHPREQANVVSRTNQGNIGITMCPHYCESLDPKDFVSSADPVMDESHSEAFEAKARQRNSIATDPKNPARATLVVGDDDWPFPVPLVKKSGKWLFDSKAQREEILYRRIGANELDAIQVCRGYEKLRRNIRWIFTITPE